MPRTSSVSIHGQTYWPIPPLIQFLSSSQTWTSWPLPVYLPRMPGLQRSCTQRDPILHHWENISHGTLAFHFGNGWMPSTCGSRQTRFVDQFNQVVAASDWQITAIERQAETWNQRTKAYNSWLRSLAAWLRSSLPKDSWRWSAPREIGWPKISMPSRLWIRILRSWERPAPRRAGWQEHWSLQRT